MKPIEIKIKGHTSKSSQDICAEFLDLGRWSEFEGYFILPGIKKAQFEVKTPTLVGSRIKVQNTDGSTHVEDIIQWDVDSKIALRFQEFQSPLQKLATHFIEAWEFKKIGAWNGSHKNHDHVPARIVRLVHAGANFVFNEKIFRKKPGPGVVSRQRIKRIPSRRRQH
jgi:hypothetical protein